MVVVWGWVAYEAGDRTAITSHRLTTGIASMAV